MSNENCVCVCTNREIFRCILLSGGGVAKYLKNPLCINRYCHCSVTLSKTGFLEASHVLTCLERMVEQIGMLKVCLCKLSLISSSLKHILIGFWIWIHCVSLGILLDLNEINNYLRRSLFKFCAVIAVLHFQAVSEQW